MKTLLFVVMTTGALSTAVAKSHDFYRTYDRSRDSVERSALAVANARGYTVVSGIAPAGSNSDVMTVLTKPNFGGPLGAFARPGAYLTLRFESAEKGCTLHVHPTQPEQPLTHPADKEVRKFLDDLDVKLHSAVGNRPR